MLIVRSSFSIATARGGTFVLNGTAIISTRWSRGASTVTTIGGTVIFGTPKTLQQGAVLPLRVLSSPLVSIWDEDEDLDDTDDDDREKPPPPSTADITPAQKYEFLQLTRQGLNRQEAANQLGYTARAWRAV